MDNGFHLQIPIQISYSYLFISLLLLPFLASCQNHNESPVSDSDFHALLALKNEFVDLRGVLIGWNRSDSVCTEWVGIKCVDSHVVVVQLPWKGIGGRISENIGRLRYLRRLSLHDNFLQGPVPESLGLLRNLRGVYLFNNRLSGSIPPSIGECPVLQTLDLSNNMLTGFIPPNLANSTRLYRLNLSFNAISGPIPVSFSQSPSLTFLALQHNNLSGLIPDEWGSKPGAVVTYKLKFLVLDHNLVSGKFPSTLTRLPLLQELNLGYNFITGSLPDELGNLSQLSSIDLSHNAISGRLPESLSKLYSLEIMNLRSNNLEYEIPDFVGKLTNLSVLDLSSNKFRGSIPDSFGNNSRITSLDFSRNNLTGEIPESLVKLLNLSFLDLSYNNLSGQVPSILALRFNSSSFTGNSLLCGYSSSNACSSAVSNTTSAVPQGEHQTPHQNRRLSAKDIVLISAGALLVMLLLVCCVLLCCIIRRKLKNRRAGGVIGRDRKPVAAVATEVETGSESGGKLVHFDGPLVFTADDLLCATAEVTGKSSYGTTYKATMEDNNQIAVKRLRERLTKPQREFENEVAQLGKIRHPNVLALRAYYLGPKGEKLLVYDFMPNGSLASFLHARGPETSISWPTRMNIAMGIARGLSHLHTEESIVHGNLTSSNIFLDEKYNAKIADAGVGCLMSTGTTTTIAPATSGMTGYTAPELSKQKNATALPNSKTDVYSLGVIMLELLTGKSPSDDIDGLDLPQRVASIVKEEWTNEVFDVELISDAPSIGDELLDTLKLALHCADPSPAARPEAPHVLQKLQEIRRDPVEDDDDDDPSFEGR